MRTVGIIAEYDPFHNGHAYQLEKARKAAEADYVIVVMSPDFLQRGEPALFDKWTRARMALEAGADLVLEMPVRFAAGSAEYFARGGVGLLNALGCVDALSFGCEDEEKFGYLEKAAAFFAGEEPEDYKKILKERLREGVSFPRARAEAFVRILSSRQGVSGCGPDESAEEIAAVLSRPNNILAVEYQKAALRLGSSLEMIPVKRLGNYHAYDSPDRIYAEKRDDSEAGIPDDSRPFVSASAIRAALLANGMTLPAALRSQLPVTSLGLMEEEIRCGRYVVPGDLDLILHKALLDNQDELQAYLDIDDELANRIRRCLGSYTGFTDFSALVQSKQYTLARIRRSLLHVLLGIKKGETQVSCARVLGFRKTAQPLLRMIRDKSSVPLSTSVPFSEIPKEDVDAAHLWEMIAVGRTGRPLRNEQQRQIITL